MYVPPQNTDHRTYRHAPSFGVTLLFAALPLAAVVAASFPAATTGFFVGAVAVTTMQR